MVSDCGGALDEIRYHPRSLRYHKYFVATERLECSKTRETWQQLFDLEEASCPSL
jgi:hypothetical protein